MHSSMLGILFLSHLHLIPCLFTYLPPLFDILTSSTHYYLFLYTSFPLSFSTHKPHFVLYVIFYLLPFV
ncbi:hypothetical protein BC941DRAFT_443404 [Chlamydoabsidia padenii]|nr:hypothetical protein BC941DRAFT_443404 [Chlamydoabsidia padenii]